MKKHALTIILLLLSGSLVFSQIPNDSLYLGQTLPGVVPQIFHLPVNAGSFAAERIAISNDGSEIYYSEVHSYYPTAGDTIKYFRYSGSNWTGPFNLFNGYAAPGLSISGDTMYFQNNSIPYQTLISVRNGLGWSNPQRILYNLNSAHYFQETNNGNYYVSSISNPSIGASDWCKLLAGGSDTTAISLGLPLNTAGDNLDFFIARDESFMIIARPGTGLCLSFHNSNGTWTNPKNLGPTINWGLGSWGPYVTSDNKYLFYTTGTNPNYSDTYIYWVRVDSLIDSLKNTNFIPFIKNKIPDQIDSVGHSFNFTVPDSTFIDDDGNNTLTYKAALYNGTPLPTWLTFDTITATFSGIPVNIETLNIRVWASDPFGATAFTTFKINIPGFADDSLYLGQTPPGNTPKVFELPVSSGLRPVERIAISADGHEIYYGEQDTWPPLIKRIKCFHYINNAWQGPTVVFEGFVCPALSVNDSIMYMQKDTNGVACTYFSTRAITGWSVPHRLLSTDLQTHYFQQTSLNNYYLASTLPNSSNSDICKLAFPGSDTTIQGLGLPINSPAIENDFFISRDESFLIVFRLSSPYDLFISYHKDDGTWTNPKSLGVKINTLNYDCSPFVTRDNKYLFFTRGGSAMSSYHTYWVNVETLIDSLHHTNFAPYVKNLIPDQFDTVGRLFSYAIPGNTFIDDDGNSTLTYSANLTNGDPLPDWLSFDTITGTFTGTSGIAETMNIRVKATDVAGAYTSTAFKINIKESSAIPRKQDPVIRIFPNPSSGQVNVTVEGSRGKTMMVEVADYGGRTILTKRFSDRVILDLTGRPAGIYILKILLDSEVTSHKICIE
jgi:hypothetical protein